MRFTFNANLDEIGDINQFTHILQAWKPPFVVLMNGLGGTNYRLVRETIRAWNGKIIYRHYEQSDGHLWRSRTASEHINLLRQFAATDPAAWYYVSNEPLPGNDERAYMQNWHVDVIQRAIQANLRLCVGNFATAAMDGTIADVNSGRWDVLLKAIGEHTHIKIDGVSQILAGFHTYAHAVIPKHCAGQPVTDLLDKVKIAQWPSPQQVYDTPGDNWLTFRENWYVDRIYQLTGQRADVVITEGVGWDRMPNIVKDHPQVAAEIDRIAKQEVKGLPTLTEFYRVMFPQWTPALTACRQMEWVENVYPENYKAFALFTWSQNPHWKAGYNVSDLTEFLQLWPNYMTTQPPAPMPTDPALPAGGWYETKAAAHPDAAIVYDKREDGKREIARILTSSLNDFSVPVKTVYSPRTNPYRPIEVNGKRGWVNISFAKFEKNEPDFNPVHSRFLPYKAYANGMSAPANVRTKPMLSGSIVALIHVGGVDVLHLPHESLTDIEQTYVTRTDGTWHVVLINGQVAFVRSDVVRMDVKPTTPPPPPPDVVTIPKQRYIELVTRSEALESLLARAALELGKAIDEILTPVTKAAGELTTELERENE